MAPPVYRASGKEPVSQLCQGEILADVVQYHLDIAALRADSPLKALAKKHPLAIVASQDCDLEQDFIARNSNGPLHKQIPNVLFCEVSTAEALKNPNVGINSTLWDAIKKNNNERYQFLQLVEPQQDCTGEGLPELGIDFKRYFTIPTDEVYFRIRKGEITRRCILVSPYLEHFSARFANYSSRVALPNNHTSV